MLRISLKCYFWASNSLQNKFFSISELVKGKVDIFLINETKLDEYFPRNQFAMSSYEFIRKERNKFGVECLFVLIINHQRRTIKIENPSQPPFTCSKLTIEALEQDVKYV